MYTANLQRELGLNLMSCFMKDNALQLIAGAWGPIQKHWTCAAPSKLSSLIIHSTHELLASPSLTLLKPTPRGHLVPHHRISTWCHSVLHWHHHGFPSWVSLLRWLQLKVRTLVSHPCCSGLWAIPFICMFTPFSSILHSEEKVIFFPVCICDHPHPTQILPRPHCSMGNVRAVLCGPQAAGLHTFPLPLLLPRTMCLTSSPPSTHPHQHFSFSLCLELFHLWCFPFSHLSDLSFSSDPWHCWLKSPALGHFRSQKHLPSFHLFM